MTLDIEKHLKTTPLYPIWKQVGIKHHHGIQVILSAIYSKESVMIGDFFDLIPLIKWCNSIGFSFIQLLPIQDTGDMTSPYSALSSLALHPIYINLLVLPFLENHPHLQKRISALKNEPPSKRLNLPIIYKKKMSFLRSYFEETKHEHLNNKAFLSFVDKHNWLDSYSLYKMFSDKFKCNNWKSWPLAYQNPTHEKRKKWKKEHETELAFHQFCQYICFTQMKEVKRVADSENVMIKGDIPILISPYSSDVWHLRHYFDINEEVGSRPSKDDPKGQHWGFPGFNWKAHEEDNFLWWRTRLEVASQFFKLYRIDHFVGLFRLWVIPKGGEPLDGKFSPESEPAMVAQGSTILSNLLAASKMLPIAEVMGNQPPFIKKSLVASGVPYLRISRYPRPQGDQEFFFPTSSFHPLSIATVSTHDIPSLRLWWSRNPELAEGFAEVSEVPFTKELSNEGQFAILRQCHQATSLFHANLLTEYLALDPELSFENLEDDVINTPGVQNALNWSFRHKTDIETIVQSRVLYEKMRALL